MSRIAAAVAVVLLLVVGGLWVAMRSGGDATVPAGAGGTEAAAPPAPSDAPSNAQSDEPGETPGDEPSVDPTGEPVEEAPADGAPADAPGDVPADAAPGEAPGDAASGADAAPADDGTVVLEPLGGGFQVEPPLAEERRISFEAPAEVLDPGRDYAGRLDTSAGTMILDLYEQETPETVNNFVFLARNGYYDGIVFHRVLENFMAQTGDPTGTGRGGPGYTFGDEIVDGLIHDQPGMLSMANAGADTNGSQFFLTFTATPWLDGRHTVFGRIVGGLEVLDALTRLDPQEPQAIALLTDTVATLREQGIELDADADVGIEALLAQELGALPVAGQSFTLAGYRGVLASVGGDPAIGLWPQPDRIESLTIYSRPR